MKISRVSYAPSIARNLGSPPLRVAEIIDGRMRAKPPRVVERKNAPLTCLMRRAGKIALFEVLERRPSREDETRVTFPERRNGPHHTVLVPSTLRANRRRVRSCKANNISLPASNAAAF